ncbi:MAG: hypothetical protein QOH95_1684 [Gaiellaceae bacterium]|jgi:hypothetical protein|nr:hypothetical protein [Gaiellaceae bacterium]
MTGPKALAQYEQVRGKVSGGLSVAAAVKAVSEETGASRGTLQSVYYRVARETGVTKPRSRSKRASSAKRRPSGATSRRRAGDASSTAELLRQLAQTATALSTRVEELERDSARLREVEAAFAPRG